jgi:hypothetical protein
LQKKNSWSSSQIAKENALKIAQDKTLGQGEGLDMGGKDKDEALFQDLSNQAQEAINKIY